MQQRAPRSPGGSFKDRLLDLPRPPLAYVAGALVVASLVWSIFDLMSHVLHAG